MRTETPVTIRLKDYTQPDYWITHTDLVIRIHDDHTEVESRLSIERNGDGELPPLKLDGVDQTIIEMTIDDVAVEDYHYEHEQLILQPSKAQFVFRAVTHIHPNENTSLEGLYKSGTMYCTQCEAEGFRKITFYQDRPDVMATFTTRIEADKAAYPVLLANGNPIEEGELEGGRHFATWHDPFVKPAYLFATVAGDLVRQDDTFVTRSGREVSLRIFAEKHNAHKTTFALESLKRSMKWDEERFGREYDLDIFMIVASDFFNMGAMENKGLNIFNSAAVLASEETSSDDRFERIEAIVAHEYFHNWSGNRVTCRDWFQLSLKEGFTVFRDGEFTADMHDRTLKRIKDVDFLKNYQFPEDNGPNAHPVQPQEYIEINNFYTVTVYEKGAEVVGMLNTLVGDELFRQGSDLYFERFDGMAVTTDDFVACMAEVSGQDFTQFKRWYTQAGTPQVDIEQAFDAQTNTYQLTFKQSCKPTPGQSEKQPFVIPVRMALLDQSGQELTIDCDGDFNADTQVLTLSQAETTVTFRGLSEAPVASLFRDFSAPVRVRFDRPEADVLLLATRDPNAFNRFDAIQQIYMDTILSLASGAFDRVPDAVNAVVEAALNDAELSHAIKATLLRLPTYPLLVDNSDTIDAQRLVAARDQLLNHLAVQYVDQWQSMTQSLASADPYRFDAAEAGRRELQGLSLQYWVKAGSDEALNYAEALYRAANNQTDRLNGLSAVLKSDDAGRKEALLVHYYRQWKDDTQMVENWLSLQTSATDVSVSQLKDLMQHEAFDLKNPNKVRSVLGGFAGNFKSFHDDTGEGYQFLAEQVATLNAINPQVAARFIKPLENWKRFSPERGEMMKSALSHILATEDLSPDVLEMAQKALA
ncbi:aminopeptidase N [Reinekea blandensis]|uniref:Aminopeptidase N n=1 Tax=Reinekea blandensis MED297 TaxID=314283 RepID=A4BC45_9GAMM|nr:aminopeptidase N [Reinekea blandensis]EAR10530.1 aminopeptidase N [Reinekea sp. MED297] [Reinekea blandensis MED297]